MRYVRAIGLLLAMSPASAMAGNEVPKISDEQMACAEAVKKEYQTTKEQLVQKATANRTVMSVDDTIAKRRLDEDFAGNGRLPFEQRQGCKHAGEYRGGHVCRLSRL